MNEKSMQSIEFLHKCTESSYCDPARMVFEAKQLFVFFCFNTTSTLMRLFFVVRFLCFLCVGVANMTLVTQKSKLFSVWMMKPSIFLVLEYVRFWCSQSLNAQKRMKTKSQIVKIKSKFFE